MMKKLLTAAVLVASFTAANAQNFKPRHHETVPMTKNQALAIKHVEAKRPSTAARPATITGMQDTLHYYLNKNFFINTAAYAGFVHYEMTSVATNTFGDLTEIGVSFKNPGNASVDVSGGYILCKAKKNAPTTNLTIPVMFYLYNATAAGIPTNKVDSVQITVDTTVAYYNCQFATVRTVTNSFYVSYKTMGAYTDTLLGYMSPAYTATVGTAYPQAPNTVKYGEGLAFCTISTATNNTVQNDMYPTTDFLGGTGTEYEATILPTVSFSINANYTNTAPTNTGTPAGSYCTTKAINFTNSTTSPVVYNHQFNFNEFITFWTPTTGFGGVPAPDPADPVDNWSFTEANAATVTYTTTNAAHTPTAVGMFTASLTTEYRPSPWDPTAQNVSISDVKSTTYSIVACTTGTTGNVGIAEISGFESLSIYPNPTVNGKTVISGLNGTNTILVFDMLGQQVSNLSSDKETVSIDLLNKANGTYIVKIINANNDAKVMRIVNQN